MILDDTHELFEPGILEDEEDDVDNTSSDGVHLQVPTTADAQEKPQ